jgi:tetratricopeptide (TPR) repeat protein
VADAQRLEELRRRVQRDPASLAFAQLAEECRRAGQYHEAVRVCREGLAHHPDYLSARVTLGRALLALDHLDQAGAELAGVLRIAPENLSALRGLAEVHERRGLVAEALRYYRAALALAPQDHEITSAIDSLEHPSPPVAVAPSPPLPAAAEAAGSVETAVASGPRSKALQRLEGWLAAIERRGTARRRAVDRRDEGAQDDGRFDAASAAQPMGQRPLGPTRNPR